MIHIFSKLPRTSKLAITVVSICVIITGFLLLSGCTGPKETGYKSYTDPNYKKKDYKQLMVFGRIEQDSIRHKVENSIVSYLGTQGYTAIPAYKHIDISYKYDSVKFMNKINELKVDGIIVVDYLGATTEVTDVYRYTGGAYTLFTYNYIPFDLDTEADRIGHIRVDFFNLDARHSLWNTVIQAKPSSGLDVIIRDFSNEFYKRAKQDGIL